MIRHRAAGAAFAALLASTSFAHGPVAASGPLEFEPPAVGSYELPLIQRVPSGKVMDSAGRRRALDDFTHGRITLLGLVYTRCTDPLGCPRATWAFNQVRARLREMPELESRTRLVTLSFDPVHDNPATLRAYGKRVGATRPGAQWDFLTTRSKVDLTPIMEGFGQDLRVPRNSRAQPGSEEFMHTLKVFLIDPEGAVREIYSSAYLIPEIVVNDMATLDTEQVGSAQVGMTR